MQAAPTRLRMIEPTRQLFFRPESSRSWPPRRRVGTLDRRSGRRRRPSHSTDSGFLLHDRQGKLRFPTRLRMIEPTRQLFFRPESSRSWPPRRRRDGSCEVRPNTSPASWDTRPTVRTSTSAVTLDGLWLPSPMQAAPTRLRMIEPTRQLFFRPESSRSWPPRRRRDYTMPAGLRRHWSWSWGT
jgi:hypothetical protein